MFFIYICVYIFLDKSLILQYFFVFQSGSFQPSNDMMLKFYSYYKQATQGPCNIPRPGFWDPVGKAKWY